MTVVVDAWKTVYPPGHEREGEIVEVVPRETLAEAIRRFSEKAPGSEVTNAKERAARAVERVCHQLESGDPAKETLAADLRASVLRLTELASR